MKKILLAASLLLLVSLSFAVTANPKPVQVDQGNGTKVTITLKGDEATHWATTSDGYTVLRNSTGQFEYAVVNSTGDLVSSGILAQDQKLRTAADITFLNSINQNLRFSQSQVKVMRQLREQVYEPNKGLLSDGKSRATKKIILLLAAFKDKAFTKTNADFTSLMNQVGYTIDGATGSFKDFYLENSYGALTYETTVAGPFTAAQNMSYYGGNNSSGNDVKPKELVTDVVKQADATVNFADFDNDGDGKVEAVYVIYAGYGEEAGGSANAIWAHAWSIPSQTCDGKTVSKYSCSAELRETSGSGITRIGVICHEFGHALGAPDYYDTNYNDTGDGEYPGTGNWDLMASGSWNSDGATPAHHNAYTKTAVYNWATATTLTSGTTVTMQSSETDKNSFYRYNTSTANEYFLLENRQKIGFDSQIPGHGMLIYRVDGSYIASHSSSNNINTGSHQGMYPVAANHTVANGISLESYSNPVHSAGCPWPGSSNKTSFTDTSIPNSKSWAGANTAKPLTAITENTTNKTVTFSFMGGVAVANDAGVAEIISPLSGASLTGSETVKATIKNFGTTDIASGLKIAYKVDNNAVVTENYSGTLAAGSTANFTFATKANLLTAGPHDLLIYTILSGDGNTKNDSVKTVVLNQVAGSLPFTESFDGNWTTPATLLTNSANWTGNGTVLNEWHKNNYTTGWEYPTSSACVPTTVGANSTTNYARFHSYGVSSMDGEIAMITPSINMTSNSSKALDFYYINPTGDDVVKVYLSLDNGASYGSSLITCTTSPTWVKKSIDLGTVGSAQAKIKFGATSDFGDNDLGLDQVSIIATTDINSSFEPQSVELFQNYPNPFNPETSINFNLGSNGLVKLAVYNIKGEMVKELINGVTTIGKHSVKFNAVGLNSGVYFYKLSTPEKTLTQKMMLLK